MISFFNKGKSISHGLPLNEAARILSKNGVLLCAEPCYEGHVIMGILAQFIPMVFQQAGEELDIELKDSISHFIKTMEFYAYK